MDTRTVTQEHIGAGAEYLRALRHLGLDPDGLLWAEDKSVGHVVLVLITSLFDHAGPYEISKHLLAAYNRAATPRSISPFVVRLHSPDQIAARRLAQSIDYQIRLIGHDLEGRPMAAPHEITIISGDLSFKREWIYKFKLPSKAPKSTELSRRWHRFERNIDRLAA